MKLYTLFTASMALLTAVSAAPIAAHDFLTLTNGDYSVTVGAPFPITWDGNDGDVTILLKAGSAENLETIGTIAFGQSGNSATWTPSTSGTYALEIADAAANTNYSPLFEVGA